MSEELLKWTIINVSWTRLIAIGTWVMAGAVSLAALVAIVTLHKSNKRQRFEFANLLYKEFTNVNLYIWKIFDMLASKKFENKEKMRGEIGTAKFDVPEQNKMDLIIYFAKLGLLIRKKIIGFEEIDLFFNGFLLNEEKINNVIYNLNLISSTIPNSLYKNIHYLFLVCSNKYGIDYERLDESNVSLDLRKIEINRLKRTIKKMKFWKRDYFREFEK